MKTHAESVEEPYDEVDGFAIPQGKTVAYTATKKNDGLERQSSEVSILVIIDPEAAQLILDRRVDGEPWKSDSLHQHIRR